MRPALVDEPSTGATAGLASGVFLLFWVFCGRWMWWGGRSYGPALRRYRRCYDDRRDEWHRREHERMDRSNATSSSSNQAPIT